MSRPAIARDAISSSLRAVGADVCAGNTGNGLSKPVAWGEFDPIKRGLPADA
jgi:hypothetical protein